VNSFPKTVTRQPCDLNPGRTAPESSTLTSRLPNHQHLLHQNRNEYASVLMFSGACVSTSCLCIYSVVRLLVIE